VENHVFLYVCIVVVVVRVPLTADHHLSSLYQFNDAMMNQICLKLRVLLLILLCEETRRDDIIGEKIGRIYTHENVDTTHHVFSLTEYHTEHFGL
jgi:hypothetical protein